MAKDNVVDFESRKRQQEEEQDPFGVMLPQAIVEQLKGMAEHVEAITNEIDETCANYSLSNNGPLDFTIPLEGLTRSILTISTEMDLQVLPEVINAHRQMRVDLSEAINQTVQQFTSKRDMPVYSQDLYIGVGLVLLSYLQQHRIFSQVRHYDTAKGETTDGGTDGSPSDTLQD